MTIKKTKEVPGTRCSLCGEERSYPVPHYGKWEDSPHDNHVDCIRHLVYRLEKAEQSIEDLRSEINGNDYY